MQEQGSPSIPKGNKEVSMARCMALLRVRRGAISGCHMTWTTRMPADAVDKDQKQGLTYAVQLRPWKLPAWDSGPHSKRFIEPKE